MSWLTAGPGTGLIVMFMVLIAGIQLGVVLVLLSFQSERITPRLKDAKSRTDSSDFLMSSLRVKGR